MTIPDTVRVLSLKQPWLWAVLNLNKDIENRVWNTSFRGPFLLHASAGMTRRYYDMAWREVERLAGLPTAGLLPPFNSPKLLRGGIIGHARLTDVLKPAVIPTRKWHMEKQFGYVLEGIEPTAFMPLKAFQRFFYVKTQDVELAIPGTVAWLEQCLAAH